MLWLRTTVCTEMYWLFSFIQVCVSALAVKVFFASVQMWGFSVKSMWYFSVLCGNFTGLLNRSASIILRDYWCLFLFLFFFAIVTAVTLLRSKIQRLSYVRAELHTHTVCVSLYIKQIVHNICVCACTSVVSCWGLRKLPLTPNGRRQQSLGHNRSDLDVEAPYMCISAWAKEDWENGASSNVLSVFHTFFCFALSLCLPASLCVHGESPIDWLLG